MAQHGKSTILQFFILISRGFYLLCVLSLFSHVRLVQPHGVQSSRLICLWDSPGKNSGVGCHFLLQGMFPTQGSNPRLLRCKWILYPLSHQGSPGFSHYSSPTRVEAMLSDTVTGSGCHSVYAQRHRRPQTAKDCDTCPAGYS